MTYDWEEEADEALRGKINKLNQSISGGMPFTVLGVVIENDSTGEAMFLPMFENDGSVLLSDLLRDAVSDLDALYEASVEARRIQ
jgi:hypothetical protein